MNESDLATVAMWSYGLATAGFALFAVRLLLGLQPGLRAALLLGATFATAAWAATGVAMSYRPAIAAWIAYTTADTIRYAVWFWFLQAILRQPESTSVTARRRALRVTLTGAVVLVLLVSIVFPYAPPSLVTPDASARAIGLGVRLALAISGLVLIEQILRRAEPSARWALKPLCIGLGGVFAFDLYMFADAMLFAHVDFQIWLARGAATALVIPFVAIATARNPTWTIDMHLSRGIVVNSTAVLLSGVFLLLVAGAGYIARFLGGDWGRALQIEVYFAAILLGVLALSSGKFRSRLRVFVSKHFFSYRYDYRQEWLRFTRALAEATRVREVQQQAIAALANLVESPAGALWLREPDGAFRPVANWNMPATSAVEPTDGSLAQFLERTGWVVDLREYAAEPTRYSALELPGWLRAMDSAWLVLPLPTAADLIGFVVLARPRANIDVNWEVRDLLKAACSQAASYLAKLRATEALVEAQKFESFNRMSAFVVHDLKNLVAQLSLMLRNAERHRNNPEFQRDMLSTVEHVVGRMNQLMLQLRTGAAPVENPGVTDLERIVRSVCASRAGAHAPIDLELAPGLLALGHEDRLDHVIGHLVQNALDATPAGGARVRVRLFREGEFVVVEVEDKGIGMTPEFMRERLFKPFETTKSAGMGIGVYESTQYVTSLGGKIDFESAPGTGTRARLQLPAADGGVASLRAEVAA